jgi:hypothetical protein
MFTRRGLPARSRVMEPRGSPTALLLSSSPVLGSAFTGNALLRSAVAVLPNRVRTGSAFSRSMNSSLLVFVRLEPREGRRNPQFFTSHRHRRPCYPGPKSTAHSCSPKYSPIDTKKFHQKTLKSKKIAVRSDFRHRDCGPPETKVAQRAGHSRPDFNPGTKLHWSPRRPR